MKKRFLVPIVIAIFVLVAGSSFAVSLDPNLIRPSVIGSGPQNENSLQTELNLLFGNGNVSAANDQLSLGMYTVSTSSTLISPQLRFEWTGNQASQGAGIFGWNGTAAVKADIFAGLNTGENNLSGPAAGDYANIKWLTDDSGYINTFDGGTGTVTSNVAFTGISRTSFGFYFEPTAGSNPTYFSVDSLNAGYSDPNIRTDRVLSYSGTLTNGNSGILFTYEDGSDWDYNDAGFYVESINPVPEPATLLLLGSGLVGLAFLKRRKS